MNKELSSNFKCFCLQSTYLLSTSIFSNVIWRLHLLMLDLNIICYIQRGFSSLMCILFTFLYCLLWSYIKKVLKENKSYARASFFPIEMKYIFTTTISHDARFSGEKYEVLFYIVHYFESQTILWQFFKCNGIFSWFFFCVAYEKQRRGPFVVGRLWVKVFYRTNHYIWSMVWQHNNTFSSLEF